MRNAQQIKMMNNFEKKCRKLYETRLCGVYGKVRRATEPVQCSAASLVELLPWSVAAWKVTKAFENGVLPVENTILGGAEQRYHEMTDNLEAVHGRAAPCHGGVRH